MATGRRFWITIALAAVAIAGAKFGGELFARHLAAQEVAEQAVVLPSESDVIKWAEAQTACPPYNAAVAPRSDCYHPSAAPKTDDGLNAIERAFPAE